VKRTSGCFPGLLGLGLFSAVVVRADYHHRRSLTRRLPGCGWSGATSNAPGTVVSVPGAFGFHRAIQAAR